MHCDTLKQDNDSTVRGDGGSRVGEVRAGTTSPMPEHKGFKLQQLSRYPLTPADGPGSVSVKRAFTFTCFTSASKSCFFLKHQNIHILSYKTSQQVSGYPMIQNACFFPNIQTIYIILPKYSKCTLFSPLQISKQAYYILL